MARYPARSASDTSFRNLLRVVLPATLLGCSALGDGGGAPLLSLKQVSAQTAFDGAMPTGVAVSRTGAVASWTATSPAINISTRDGAKRRIAACPENAPIRAEFLSDGATLEVLCAHPARIIRHYDGDSAVLVGHVKIADALRNAVRTNAGWIVGANDSVGALQIYRLRGDSAPALLFTVAPAQHGLDSLPVAAHLSAHPRGVAVTVLRPPHSIVVLATNGEVVSRPDPLLTPRLAHTLAGHPEAVWVSQPLVALDDGAMQMLTDLRSDSRIVVFYDRSGRPVRFTQMRAPIGFVESLPEKRILIAARQLNIPEIVVYQWTWSTSTFNQGG